MKWFGTVLQMIWTFIKSSILTAAIVAAPIIAIGVAITVMVFTSLPGPVPEPRPIFVSKPATLFDADGNQIAVLRAYDEARETTSDDINQTITNALVASEDRRFFEHTGVDPIGVARAARSNLDEGEAVQGGSTITQQLVKNRYLGGEQTMARKIREAVLAQRLETEFTKDQIIHQYLSSVYFGSSAYGLRSAAEVYFRADPKSLDASQAAIIIGTLPSPSANSPHNSAENSELARRRVLDAMLQEGYLTQEQYEWETARRIVLLDQNGMPPEGTEGPYTGVWPRPTSEYGPYPKFASYVSDYLVGKYGQEAVFQKGLIVETTLRPGIQNEVQAMVERATEGGLDPGTTSASTVIEPATGFIMAMADSRSWETTQVNYATGGSTGFQPGSSFKPFTLLAAMEAGISPEEVINYGAGFTTADGTVLRNYGGEGGGSTTIRNATHVSLNVPYVILADRVGPSAVAEVANRAGIKKLDPNGEYGVSITLGAYEVSPLEMASAYATFANRGLYMSPVPVVRVLTSDGQVLEDNTIRAGEQVFDPVVIDNLNNVLQGVVQKGTGTAARVGDRPIAGKTGTAENYTAAWFVGYTPNFSGSIWLGHDNGNRTLNINGNRAVVGGGPPATAWGKMFANVSGSFPADGFFPPGPLPPPRPKTDNNQPLAPEQPKETVPPPPERLVVIGPQAPKEKTATEFGP